MLIFWRKYELQEGYGSIDSGVREYYIGRAMVATAETQGSFIVHMQQEGWSPRHSLKKEERRERTKARRELVGRMDALLSSPHAEVRSPHGNFSETRTVPWTPVEIEGLACELQLWKGTESVPGLTDGAEYHLLVRIDSESVPQSIIRVVRQISPTPVSSSVTNHRGNRAELLDYRNALAALGALEKAKPVSPSPAPAS